MSASASQAAAFYREVAKEKRLWTVRDEGGFPAPKGSDGTRAFPFWSSLSRVETIIRNVPAYAKFTPVEVSWTEFVNEWIPDATNKGFKIGVNWSGALARGYDLKPEKVRKAVETLFDPEHSWWKRILK